MNVGHKNLWPLEVCHDMKKVENHHVIDNKNLPCCFVVMYVIVDLSLSSKATLLQIL